MPVSWSGTAKNSRSAKFFISVTHLSQKLLQLSIHSNRYPASSRSSSRRSSHTALHHDSSATATATGQPWTRRRRSALSARTLTSRGRRNAAPRALPWARASDRRRRGKYSHATTLCCVMGAYVYEMWLWMVGAGAKAQAKRRAEQAKDRLAARNKRSDRD